MSVFDKRNKVMNLFKNPSDQEHFQDAMCYMFYVQSVRVRLKGNDSVPVL